MIYSIKRMIILLGLNGRNLNIYCIYMNIKINIKNLNLKMLHPEKNNKFTNININFQSFKLCYSSSFS